jgi:hypothetical protein
MHVLVLVHGYRNPIKNVAAYGKLESELTKRGLIAGELRFGDRFSVARISNGDRILRGGGVGEPFGCVFRDFLKTLNSSAHTVDVQTHSLAAGVALQAMAFEHLGGQGKSGHLSTLQNRPFPMSGIEAQ